MPLASPLTPTSNRRRGVAIPFFMCVSTFQVGMSHSTDCQPRLLNRSAR